MATPALRLYSYGACGTCRKALAWLKERGIEAEVLDITRTPPELAVLQRALEQLGRSRLFNTSGQSYRALGAATVRSWDEATALAALHSDGKLIKRPLLVAQDGSILTGFQPGEWEQLLPTRAG
jgi:arsenate reductase